LQGGFTLLEVLMAVLVAMVGLIGTVAVQQATLSATANANDAQVAMRLAMTSVEQFSTRHTQASPFVDMLAPVASPAWTTPVYLDTQAHASATQTPPNRWRLRTRVANTGVGLPYNISVEISYGLNTGAPKTVRLDLERRKTW
jgi:Tfp pilus assembly protein PilV